MKHYLTSLSLLFAFFSLPNQQAWAYYEPLVMSPGSITFSNDGNAHVGMPLTSSWIAETYVTNGFACIGRCWINGAYISKPASPVVDGVYYYEGNDKYPVYSIPGVKGIGYAFAIKDVKALFYKPYDFSANSMPRIYPSTGSIRQSVSIGLQSKIIFVITDENVEPGIYNIPFTRICDSIGAYTGSSAESWTDFSSVNINPTTITIKGDRACTINTKNLIYELGDLSMHDMANIGATSKMQSKPVSITCRSNVHLSASMTDQSNTSNNTDILTLTPSSDAKGLGIQFFFNDDPTPVVYGPDIRTPGQSNQRPLHITTTNNENYILNLSTRYITTGALKPGKANGLASLTFTYQ